MILAFIVGSIIAVVVAIMVATLLRNHKTSEDEFDVAYEELAGDSTSEDLEPDSDERR